MSASDRPHLEYLDSEGIRVQTGIYTVADWAASVFREGPPIILYDAEATLPSGLVEAITQVIPFECLCDHVGGHVCRRNPVKSVP